MLIERSARAIRLALARYLWFPFAALVLASCTGSAMQASPQSGSIADTERPNIIFILADDLGPGLIGANGQTIVDTPNIDRLFAEGMSFSDFYTPVFCAPSRWALMTGMHDGREGGWGHVKGGLDAGFSSGEIDLSRYDQILDQLKSESVPIPPEEVFTAQLAQSAGYVTAQFGKLDQGFTTWDARVRRFGWDYHEGFYDHVCAHGFYPPYIWRNGEKVFLEGNDKPACGKMSEEGNEPLGAGGQTYVQDVFMRSILQFIRDNRDRPFFLYHPTQLPHGPVSIPALHPDYANRSDLSLAEKKYASMVRMLDDNVGAILAELKAQGLDDKTIVFFATDNGHELYYGPKPNYQNQMGLDGQPTNLTDRKWRTADQGDVFNGAGDRAGLKRSGYQGGIQSVLVARWPGHVAPGVVTNRLTAQYDFLATLAELVGQPVPRGKDSLSYLPTLLGREAGQEHDYVIIQNRFDQMGSAAIITNDGWKLVEIDAAAGRYQLYNVRSDNAERHNLIASHPAIASRLKAILLREIGSARPDLN